MPNIFVDNEVFACIQKIAIPFVDKDPNSALRRYFGLKENGTQDQHSSGNEVGIRKRISRRSRKPKIFYRELEREQTLINGQTLYLCDGPGRRIADESGQYASGGKIRYEGKLYAPSTLARELLVKHGHGDTERRGPLHWCNENNTKLMALWQEYLSRNPNFSYP